MKLPNTMKAAAAFALGALLYTPTAFAAEGDTLLEIGFDTDDDFQGFFDQGDRLKALGWDGTTITGEEMVSGGVFSATVTQGDNDPQSPNPNDAQFTTNTDSGSIISLDADIVGSLEVRIRQSEDFGATWRTAGAINPDLIVVQGTVIQGDTTTQTADETVAGDGWTIVTYDLYNVFGKTITNLRLDPTNALDDSFEIDYIRFIETEVAPPISVEIDPASAVPAGFNLVKEWDSALQLAEFTPSQLQKADLTTGVDIGPCTVNAAEDCIYGITTGGDSKLTSPGGLSIPIPEGNNLIIEIGVIGDNDFGTTTSELFWNDASGAFGQTGNRVLFPAVPDDDGLHVIRVSFAGSSSGMLTTLNQFRYDPSIGEVALDIEVDYIRIYTDLPLPTELFWDTDTSTAADQGGTGPWNTTDNFWYDGLSSNVLWPAVPTGDDNAIFGGTAGTVTIDAGGITAHSLKFTVDGYTLGGGDLFLDSSESDAFINVDGGGVTATVESIVDGTIDNARKSGTGTLILDNDNVFNSFTVAGGALNIPAGRSLTTTAMNPGENNFGFKMTAGGTLNLDGSLTVDEGNFGGFSGDGNWTANINAGSVLNIGNAYAGWNAAVTYNFNDGTTNSSGFLRHQDGGDPTINFAGGTHTFAGNLDAITNGGNSDTVVNITGGTVSAANVQFNPSTGGPGTGSNSYTVNLDGGILETNRVSLRRGGGADGGGTNTLNLLLNGGILRASTGGDSSTLIDGNLGEAIVNSSVVYNATVESGGAIIDTNEMNKSVDQPLVEGATLGGGLTKQGTGALYLNEENTYVGDTLVTAGTLGGEGDVLSDVIVSPGAGLAYFETDPSIPTGGLYIDGDLSLPDPLVISIDSGNGTFNEADATGLIVADAGSITGSPATITLDTTSFTGFGSWSNPRIVGNQVLVDYTAGSNPFASYMAGFFPGETDPLIVGPNADPDGDGISNLKEFAMGGNPSLIDAGGPQSAGVNDVTGTDYFTLTIAVRNGAMFSGGVDALTASIDGVDYTIDGTGDLQDFSALIEEVPAIEDGLVAPTDYELKTFRLNPDASAGIGFIRCTVAETP